MEYNSAIKKKEEILLLVTTRMDVENQAHRDRDRGRRRGGVKQRRGSKVQLPVIK